MIIFLLILGKHLLLKILVSSGISRQKVKNLLNLQLQGGAKVVGQCSQLIIQLLLVRAQIVLAQTIPKPLVNSFVY